jgi:tetratricopeptide (TPR) repeat protein
MKKKYAAITRKENSPRDTTLSLSIVVLARHNPEGIDHFLGSIKKIRKPSEKDFDIIISAPENFQVRDKLSEIPELSYLLDKDRFCLPVHSNTSTDYFREVITCATKENILIIESDRLAKSFNLEEFFYLKQEKLSNAQVLFTFFSDQSFPDISKVQCPLILCRKEFVSYLTATMNCIDYQQDILFMLRQLRIPFGRHQIAQTSPLTQGTGTKAGILQRESDKIGRTFLWNFIIPAREIKSKPWQVFSFISSSSLYRILFYLFSLVLLVLIPVLSRDAGLSGDEEKHYRQAEKVYNYYATRGEDQSALSDPENKLNYYGQSFDFLTYVFNKAFSIDNPYEARHVLNAIAGFLTIFFSGLLAAFLAGYRAGLITLVLMFITPSFLGHSFNNSMDIPFALGYIFTIYQVIRFLHHLPRFSVSTAVWITLGIAFTISIRIGGLMLLPYIFAFAALYVIVNKWEYPFLSKNYLGFVWKGLLYLVLISVFAYLLSLLLWPYGLQKPLRNPFEALRMMSNITVSIRVLFDSAIHWSNRLPWYYISKNILYTVPVIILAGFLLNIFLVGLYRKQFKPVFAVFLFFAILFPVSYVVYKDSNVYGGWRHLLFVFPPMAILAAISFNTLITAIRSRYLKWVPATLLLLGSFHPVKFIVTNHPFEYMYFNEIMGGINSAYGKFETDYYLNSLKQGCEWLIDNVISKKPADNSGKIRVASNASISYYFRNYTDRVIPFYTRYYDRGGDNWDYAVFFCNYISPDQLKNNLWPPYNTIYTVRVDTVPVCAVVERKSKKDFEAISMVDQKNYVDGIPLLEEVVREEPLNELALIKLSEAYIAVMEYQRAIEAATRCLKIYPDYDKALNLIGIAYLNQGDADKAINTFIEITRINYRFVSAYHNIGLAYIRKNDIETAKIYFKKAIEVNQNFKPSYLAMAEILNRQGLTEEANRYMQVANTL